MNALTTTICSAAIAATASTLRAEAGDVVRYRLEAPSTLVRHTCLGPCACVPQSFKGPLTGTFLLVDLGEGPLFHDFDIRALNWSAVMDNDPAHPLRFQGAGFYRIGGEVAITHQMLLDLQSSAGEQVHADSQFKIASGAAFPAIQIDFQSDLIVCTLYEFQLLATPTCSADFDGSGFVDTDDFDAFVQEFVAGTDPADFDASGFVDTDDFDAFIRAFESGC